MLHILKCVEVSCEYVKTARIINSNYDVAFVNFFIDGFANVRQALQCHVQSSNDANLDQPNEPIQQTRQRARKNFT